VHLVAAPSVVQLVDLDVDRPIVDGDRGGGPSEYPAPVHAPRRGSRGITRASLPARAETSLRAELGEIAIASRDGDGDGTGSTGLGGKGHGLGGPAGLGHGAGGDPILTQPLPPPPKISKARPPKLIYPTRERDVGEGELLVARVTIDTEGFVVGAKLVAPTSPNTRRAGEIFRFRYTPALDDDGQPVRATIDQPFLVQ